GGRVPGRTANAATVAVLSRHQPHRREASPGDGRTLAPEPPIDRRPVDACSSRRPTVDPPGGAQGDVVAKSAGPIALTLTEPRVPVGVEWFNDNPPSGRPTQTLARSESVHALLHHLGNSAMRPWPGACRGLDRRPRLRRRKKDAALHPLRAIEH